MQESSDSCSFEGGALKNMRKYPRIWDYLQQHHKRIFDIVESLGMYSAFVPKHENAGITFLLPTDESYIKELEQLAESMHPEEATVAIGALILTDVYKSAADFDSKKDDIPTFNGTRLVIKSIGTNNITLDHGELTPDKKFIPFDSWVNKPRGNMAVWLLKGKVDYKGAPKATFKYVRGSKKVGKKRGGHEEIEHDEYSHLVRGIIHKQVDYLAQNAKGSEGKKCNALLEAVARVLRTFCEDKDFYSEYRKARSILTGDPDIDFYLLFCNSLVFSKFKIQQAYKCNHNKDSDVDTIKKFFSDFEHPALSEGGKRPLIFEKSGLEELKAAREDIIKEISAKLNKATLESKIIPLYDSIDRENKLKNLHPVYPEDIVKCFEEHSKLHILIDEVKHCIFRKMEAVHAEPTAADRAKAFKIAYEEIHTTFGDLKNPKQTSKLVNPSRAGIQFDPQNIYNFVGDFWKSFGIHLPYCGEKSGGLQKLSHGKVYIYGGAENVDSEIHRYLNTLDNSELQLSDEFKSIARSYKRIHGKVPLLD